MESLNLFLLPLGISLLVSFISCPIAIYISRHAGLIDDPRVNKHPKVLHTKPTPRGGVISIFSAIGISATLFLPLDNHLKGILAGAVVLLVMGLLDDKYNLNPYLRLAIQGLAASMPILAGIGIAFINNPFGGGIIDLSHPRIIFELSGNIHTIWVLSDLFALIWIISLMNFINMGAKGLPGQLPGVVGIAAITIAILSFKFTADITEWPVTVLAGITAGAFIGFIPWNMYPQRIMPGFGGSTLGGYLLGILAILTTTKIGTLFLVLAIPVIDTTYRIISRVMAHKSPVWGDRGHLHHKLLDIGWSQKKTTYFYWLVTALLGAIAVHIEALSKLYTIMIVALILALFILWFTTQSKRQKTS